MQIFVTPYRIQTAGVVSWLHSGDHLRLFLDLYIRTSHAGDQVSKNTA